MSRPTLLLLLFVVLGVRVFEQNLITLARSFTIIRGADFVVGPILTKPPEGFGCWVSYVRILCQLQIDKCIPH